MYSVNKGFTLIESLIYIALFTLILSGGFATAYNLIEGTDRLNTRTVIIEESNFVLRKINWVLNGAETVTVPSFNTLEVTKFNGKEYEITLDGTVIEMSEVGGETNVPLTTENVEVLSLNFEYLPADSGSPAGIISTINIDGIISTTTRYIRK